MLNSCQIQGRLTTEPELNTSGSTQVVRFTLASQRSFKNKNGDYDADFIRCTAFGQRANFIAQHFHKGQKMIVVIHLLYNMLSAYDQLPFHVDR